MKGHGSMTNSMDMGKCTMISPLPLKVVTTTAISNNLTKDGNITKEFWCRILKKGLENLCCRMDNTTKASLRMIELMGKEDSQRSMDR